MKIFIGSSLAVICLLGAFTLSEQQQRSLLTQQIADYQHQNTQLLQQIEDNSLQKLATAKLLQSLQSELNNRESQLASLSRQLETTLEQIDPDYQQIETRIRQQLTREIQASNNTLNSDPRIAALKQLWELDPMELGEIIAINSLYGDFIGTLNVSEERKEVVVNALQNLIADQQQAQAEIIQELQANPQTASRDDLLRRMSAVSDPSSQLEALSYDLTESELDAFREFQEQRQNSFSSFITVGGSTNSSANGPVFFESTVTQSGSGQSSGIQALPVTPGDYRPFFSPTSSNSSASEPRN